MTLPADATIFIQGPANNQNQISNLHKIRDRLELISTTYMKLEFKVSLSSPFAELLATRSSRDEYAAANNLIGITWSPLPESGEGSLILWAENESSLADLQNRVSSTIVNDSLCLPTASSKPFREIYIPWPNTSVRFLLNEASNKQRLESLIHDFPLTLSVSQSEYDPKIAFIVWGPHLEVITAEQKLQAFLEQLTTDIETVEVSLSTDQTNFLLNEACVFEHIEAIYGVHAELHQHYENKWDRALYTSFDFDPVPNSEPDRSFSLQSLNGPLIQILIVCIPLRELDNKASKT